MQAITCKTLAVTDKSPQRVKATAQAGSKIVEWNAALDMEDNHVAAAKALAEKLKWYGAWYSGGLPDGSSVYVIADGLTAFAVWETPRPRR
jgi:hypothetical protein